MIIKIWTLEADTDCGTDSFAFGTEQELDAALCDIATKMMAGTQMTLDDFEDGAEAVVECMDAELNNGGMDTHTWGPAEIEVEAPSSMTNLYLINSNADEDFSLSLFVEALDSDQARELWRKHCHDNEWPRPAESTITIFRAPPLSGKTRAICWNDVDQRITGA